jgi:hypothetical protein
MRKLADSDPPQPRLAKAIPYDCRGSFISLHLRAGDSPLEVAKWAGHSPQVMFGHYANVIDELVGEPALPAVEQIARARQAVSELERQELDELINDLIQYPTVQASGGGAAKRMYGEGFHIVANAMKEYDEARRGWSDGPTSPPRLSGPLSRPANAGDGDRGS